MGEDGVEWALGILIDKVRREQDPDKVSIVSVQYKSATLNTAILTEGIPEMAGEVWGLLGMFSEGKRMREMLKELVYESLRDNTVTQMHGAITSISVYLADTAGEAIQRLFRRGGCVIRLIFMLDGGVLRMRVIGQDIQTPAGNRSAQLN